MIFILQKKRRIILSLTDIVYFIKERIDMEKRKLTDILKSKSYPGRGIAVGVSADGRFARIAYFIMGRSTNSRNRIFVEDGEGIRTQAFDESRMEDPSLIIYAPVRVFGKSTIVTNGNQTDTVYEGLSSGLSFEQSLRSRCYEPDGPNYTPRISALLTVNEGRAEYEISILKSADGNPDGNMRYTFSYTPAIAGEGRFISTYVDDGNPLPSFSGEPVRIEMGEADIDTFTNNIWEALNKDNKVSLFTRVIDLQTGTYESRIVNVNV